MTDDTLTAADFRDPAIMLSDTVDYAMYEIFEKKTGSAGYWSTLAISAVELAEGAADFFRFPIVLDIDRHDDPACQRGIVPCFGRGRVRLHVCAVGLGDGAVFVNPRW